MKEHYRTRGFTLFFLPYSSYVLDNTSMWYHFLDSEHKQVSRTSPHSWTKTRLALATPPPSFDETGNPFKKKAPSFLPSPLFLYLLY